MTERFSLAVVARHLLLRLDGGLALVDTGAPFDIGRGRETQLGGATWAPPSTYVAVLRLASAHLGVTVEWLIGHPTLARLRLQLDWVAGQAVVSDEPIAPPGATRLVIEVAPALKVPRVEIQANDVRVPVVLDSGAMLSYVPPSVVDGRAPIRRARDFHPSIGAFETDVWSLPITVGGRAIALQAGVLPDALAPLRAVSDGWILGSDFFDGRTIVLDYPGGCVLDLPGGGERAPE
jgi:hypothetical protein